MIILPPPTGQCVRFFILTEFYGQTLCVCRACFPTCISQLTSFAVTTSRTVSELIRLTHTLSQCEPNIGTPQVTSEGSGSVISPYYHKVKIRPCLSPLVLPRQWLQSNVEFWRGPRTVQLRVSSPSLTLTLKVYQIENTKSSFFPTGCSVFVITPQPIHRRKEYMT